MRRRPPTRMPATPSSQPLITCPAPSPKLKVSPRSQLASNCLRVRQDTPDVVHLHLGAGGGLVAVAHLQVLGDQVGGRGLAGGDVHVRLLVGRASGDRTATASTDAVRSPLMPQPPAAPRRPHPIVAHGKERVDDWYWLRSDDRSDPEVLDLLAAENEFVGRRAQPHRRAAVDALQGDEGADQGDRPVGAVPQGRPLVLQPHRGGPAVPDPVPHRRRAAGRPRPRTTSLPGEQVLLDLNVLAGDSDYFALGAYDLAPGQDLLLYSTDHDGSEKYTMRVRDLRTGDRPRRRRSPRPPTARRGRATTTFFYVRPDADHAPASRCGATRSARRPTTTCWCTRTPTSASSSRVGLSLTEEWVHLTSGSKVTSEEHLIPAADPTPRAHGSSSPASRAWSTTPPTRRLPTRTASSILTNADDAVNFKLVTAPVDDPGRGALGGARRPPARREARGRLGLRRPPRALRAPRGRAPHRRHALRRRRRARAGDARGGLRHRRPPPTPSSTTTTLRFTYTSLVTPGTVFDEDLDTGERTLLKTTEVLGRPRSRPTTSPGDSGPPLPTAPGCRSPTCTGPTSPTTAPAPCLLYGYGSYEACIDPGFSTLRLSLLDRGFVFAIAHVRGGGEMGRPWYDDGKLLHKRNTFTDFIACAEHLVAEGFTAPTASSHAARRPAGSSWARSPTSVPTSSRPSSPRCPSSTA